MVTPTALTHISDWRLCHPQGPIRPDWATVYWLDVTAQATAIPGVNGVADRVGQCREVVTLSQLRVEKRLN